MIINEGAFLKGVENYTGWSDICLQIKHVRQRDFGKVLFCNFFSHSFVLGS